MFQTESPSLKAWQRKLTFYPRQNVLSSRRAKKVTNLRKVKHLRKVQHLRKVKPHDGFFEFVSETLN